jgi:hypothetical protein
MAPFIGLASVFAVAIVLTAIYQRRVRIWKTNDT